MSQSVDSAACSPPASSAMHPVSSADVDASSRGSIEAMYSPFMAVAARLPSGSVPNLLDPGPPAHGLTDHIGSQTQRGHSVLIGSLSAEAGTDSRCNMLHHVVICRR